MLPKITVVALALTGAAARKILDLLSHKSRVADSGNDFHILAAR